MSNLFSHRAAAGGAAPRLSGAEPSPRLALPAPLRYGVLGVLLFLLIGAQGGGAERQSGIAAVAALILCLLGPMPQWALRRRLSLPVAAAGLYFLLNCAAGLYSRFGSFAAVEFGKILAAFCVFLAVVLRARRGEGPQLAAMAASVSAAFGLLSIDASAARVLSGPYERFMDGVLGCTYRNLYTGYENGTRIVGIFSNPNFLAGFLALGIFLSLYLLRVSRTRRGRLGASLALMVNALSFLLAFSMGAIGTFLAAVLLYLLAERKGRRVSLFVLLVETAAVTLLMTFLAIPGLGEGSGWAALLPDLAALLGGVLLWVLHEFAGLPLSARLALKGRTAAIAALALSGALAVYLALAFQVTGGYALAPGESLRRSVYPAAGTYTLEGEWEGAVTVTVEAQNLQDTVMHTSKVLYRGGLDEASFTVPEETRVVYLTFRSADGAELRQVSLSGGPRVKLGYKLLPGFAANRLQGLWANQNAIQRLAFFQDGLRIYARSPIFGNGLGCVEGLVFSVQDFYYESKYVHNQYIQALAEMGIPGLLSFLFLLGSTAAALLLRRRAGEEDHLLPALLSCLAMSALHGLTEVDWSMGPYQVLALLTFGMAAAYFATPLPAADRRPAALAVSAGTGVFCAVFAVLLGGNVYAENAYAEVKAGLREQTPYTMTELAGIDRYDWAQYKLDMAVNAAESPVEEYASTAARYAEEVRALRIYSINKSLETYVYLPMGRYEELFQASREGIPQAASKAEVWQQEFSLYETLIDSLSREEDENLSWFAEEIGKTCDMLEEYNAGRLEQITLTDRNLAFLDRILLLRDTGLTGAEARSLYERSLFESGRAADLDADGIPDRFSAPEGALSASGGGWRLEAGGSLNLTIDPSGSRPVELTLRCGAGEISSLLLDGEAVAFDRSGDTLSAVLDLGGGGGERRLTLKTEGGVELHDLSLIEVE